MDIFSILNMIGGLSLFLYGMSTMGNALSKMAGGKLESVLEKLTARKVFAVLLGAGVTAVIQSSSATTVMVVGFVNSGIMKLSQAVGIIMGANVGTTVTSWILSLTGIEGDSMWIRLCKPSSFSPILAAVGIALIMSSKGESKKKDAGGILIGFAILMFGMEAMSTSMAGLADNPTFTSFMIQFSNPILGMVVGALLTALIQSSSASVGILQALCSTGAVPYAVAIPIIMGQNIGTCVTSLISAIGASKNAKRAAMVHLYFNFLGTVLFTAAFYLLHAFMEFAFLGCSVNAVGIAGIHSLFNIGTTIVLFPFSQLLVKLAEVTIPDDENMRKKVSREATISIDERFLVNPAFAMEICRRKAREMAEVTEEAIDLSMETLLYYNEGKIQEVIRLESVVDKYEDVLGTYLVKLSGRNLSVEDTRTMSMILHSLSDFERISDHALDIVKFAQELHEKGLHFTDEERQEIETLSNAVRDICHLTIKSFRKGDRQASLHVEPLEEVIDTLCKNIKENYIHRLQIGKCTIEMGFILEGLLIGLERVSDHCSNIAVEMITLDEYEYNTHAYFKNFSVKERKEFKEEYAALMKKYPLGLQNDKDPEESRR